MLGITHRRLAAASAALGTTFVLTLILATTVAAGRPIVHRVHAGGPDGCVGWGYPPGCDASFSLVAVQRADGSVSGQLTDQFGWGVGGYHALIDCLSVSGNDAWVSGWIAHGTYGDLDVTGWPIVVRVRDNGSSANGTPDQISIAALEPACDQQPDLPLFDAPQGQVLVQ
jgi:hypothetical protein